MGKTRPVLQMLLMNDNKVLWKQQKMVHAFADMTLRIVWYTDIYLNRYDFKNAF